MPNGVGSRPSARSQTSARGEEGVRVVWDAGAPACGVRRRTARGGVVGLVECGAAHPGAARTMRNARYKAPGGASEARRQGKVVAGGSARAAAREVSYNNVMAYKTKSEHAFVARHSV